MADYFEIFLYMAAAGDLAFAVYVMVNGGWRVKSNRYFTYFTIGSALWSFAFGRLLSADNVSDAYIARSIGIAGMFISFIFLTVLFSELAKLKTLLKYLFNGFAILGLIIYPFNIRRDYIIFFKTRFGMLYSYVNDIWGTLFVLYTVLLCVIFLVILLHMAFVLKLRRYRRMAWLMFAALVVMAVGDVFDTLLPQFGMTSIPASTFAMFPCTFLVFVLVAYGNKNRLSISTVSNYIFNSIKTAMLVYDKDKRLVLFSQEAADMLGIDADADYSEKDMFSLFDLDSEPSFSDDRVLMLDGTTKDGKKRCQLSVNRLYDSYGDILGYLVAVYDITERFELISKLEESKKRADEANQAKSVFLANMSHEIRTPINTVLGMNEMISREVNSPSSVMKYSEDIKNAGENLLSIINDILDFSKVEAGKMEISENPYELKPMLSGLATMFRLKARERGLEFKLDIDPSIPSVLVGDEVRIRQVLINLLTNGVKYTRYGSVTLSAKAEKHHDVCELIYEVVDTGIGIRKEDINSLFMSFERLDEQKTHHIEGTGLGLSIVKELVQLMHATLEVESEYGKGSTFRFVLKQKIVDEEPIGEINEDAALAMRKAYKESFTAPEATVLVVDDNIMNLQVIKGLLKRTKVRLDTAENGSEFLKKAAAKKYNIILLDHMMPVMDGLKALELFKAIAPEENLSRDAKVIALTANAVHGAKEFYLEKGFEGYLSKPVQSEELEAVIKDMLPDCLVCAPSEEVDASATAGADYGTDSIADRLFEYGVSLELGLSYCATMEIFTVTAQTFVDSVETSCERLGEFRDNEDADEYRILIHGIKSNARTLGCNSLYEYALSQEEACKNDQFEKVREDRDKPEQLIRHLAVGLTKALGLNVSSAETDAETGETLEFVLTDENRELIENIIAQLEDFDSEAAEENFDKLQTAAKATSAWTAVKEAAAKLSVYEYDAAADILKDLIG